MNDESIVGTCCARPGSLKHNCFEYSTSSAAGIATITIANEAGVKVLNDNEEVLGSGSHFFYFSAKDLPSGTYYYTIEFPQGVIIASKTMLVVK
jgi:hypothetical protein